MRAHGRQSWRGVAALTLGLGASLMQARDACADDRSAALAILSTLDAAGQAAAGDAITNSRDALERGTRMRGAGDDSHARIAEGLALEWAETARDRARTIDVEKQARTSERATIDAGAHVERERALLEEAIARSGRLRAELAATTKEGTSKTKEHTAAVAGADALSTSPAPSKAPSRTAMPSPPPHPKAGASGTKREPSGQALP